MIEPESGEISFGFYALVWPPWQRGGIHNAASFCSLQPARCEGPSLDVAVRDMQPGRLAKGGNSPCYTFVQFPYGQWNTVPSCHLAKQDS